MYVKTRKLLGIFICLALLSIFSIVPYFSYSIRHSSVYDQSCAQKLHTFKEERRHPCLYDLLTAVDKSASCMDKTWLCDDLAGKSDIVCRWFRSQNESLGADSCLLPEDINLDDKNLVPKIVYFVCVGLEKLTFLQYMAFLSAWKFVKPWAIYAIGDARPSGYWYGRVEKDLGARFVQRNPPERLNNKTVKAKSHASDIIRLQVLLANGGIYLDLDMLVLRSLEPLRVHDITLGLLDNGTGMGNAFIVAKRHSPFIRKWYENYENYTNELYYENSLLTARRLWLKNPSGVNLESNRIYYPNWNQRSLMFNESNATWGDNYGMHIWMDTKFSFPKSPPDIDKMNNTLGQVLRYIYYGDSRLVV